MGGRSLREAAVLIVVLGRDGGPLRIVRMRRGNYGFMILKALQE